MDECTNSVKKVIFLLERQWLHDLLALANVGQYNRDCLVKSNNSKQ